MCMKEKVKLGMVRFTGCSTVFHGKDVLDTEEKVRQGKVHLTSCSKMFQGKDRLDTKEKVRQAGHKGKGETGWTQKKR